MSLSQGTKVKVQDYGLVSSQDQDYWRIQRQGQLGKCQEVGLVVQVMINTGWWSSSGKSQGQFQYHGQCHRVKIRVRVNITVSVRVKLRVQVILLVYLWNSKNSKLDSESRSMLRGSWSKGVRVT